MKEMHDAINVGTFHYWDLVDSHFANSIVVKVHFKLCKEITP